MAEHLARMRSVNTSKILVGKSLGKCSVGIPMSCQDNIQMFILRRWFVWMGVVRIRLKIVCNGRLWS
jgi:hypothetical protein